MNFEMAIKCLKQGERIKRRHWKAAYLLLENKKVKMRMGFRKPWFYQFTNIDMMADDWLIHVDASAIDDFADLKPLTGRLNFAD